MRKHESSVVNNIFRSLFMAVMLFGSLLPLRAQQPSKLTGTPIGSTSVDYATGAASSTVNTPQCAFDGDLNSFYASYDRSYTWVGLDLGTPHVITRVGWSPRNDHNGPNRVQLGLFEGSNRADFLDAVPLYLISETGEVGVIDHADVCVSRGFRYVRYLGPDNARCNIAELEFYGYEGAGDDSRFYQITNLPTLSIHVYSGQEPYDKTHELESNMTLVYDGGTRIQEYPITARLRGNASQGFPKKPYRIKFNDGKSHHMMKDSPLESPAKAKKWTLINNYGDKTLMRNILSFEVSRRLGMPYTPYCQPVDVVMNGEYKGCYQLCDQITADPNRVNITEMEPSDNEEPNITGGYLVEVDAYASGEKSWFQTKRGMPVTIKEPSEDDITPQQKQYITNYFNLLEDAVFSSEFKDSVNGYRKYLDMESFVRHFIVGEFTGNTDTYWSTYMSKNRNSDQFQVAPSWDFDLAFNNDSRTYPVCNRGTWVYLNGGSSAYNMNNFVKRIFTDPYADGMLKRIWKEKLESGDMAPDNLLHFVDSMAQVLDASQRLNFIRWPILNSQVHMNAFALGSYEAEVNVLRDYIPERVEWINDYLHYSDVEIKDTTIYIASAQQMVEFAKYVNRGGAYTKGVLTTDIDMAGITNYPAAGKESAVFHGEFDGQGHVISNLHIKGGNYTGVFGVVGEGAYIHDFTLDASCSISGTAFVGIVGGSNGTGIVTIERVGNEANISGTAQNVSGIFGCNMSSSATLFIAHCYNTGTISGGHESGALSGWLGSNATVENCYNIGPVSGVDNNTRTFARYSGGCSFYNCYESVGDQVTRITADQAASGELCYKLNASGKHEVWRQDLQSDAYPMLRRDRLLVAYDKSKGGYYNLPDDNSDGLPVLPDGNGYMADVYDLNGRVVRKAATSLSGLKKGIYLVNGRKVVVR